MVLLLPTFEFTSVYLGTITRLKGTVEIIEQTVNQMFSNLSIKEHIVKTSISSVDQQNSQHKIESLFLESKELNEGLLRALKVAEGVSSMLTSYEQRYEATPEYEGLQELRALNQKTKDYVTALLTQYTELEGRVASLFGNKSLSLGNGPIGNPAGDLKAYCESYCPGITIEKAEIMALKGKLLVQKILTSEKAVLPAKDPKESQEELASITWFLMSRALSKEQAHNEGTFAIEDSNERLFNFLANSPGYAAGPRQSSHYVGRSEPDDSLAASVFTAAKQYGVDIIEAPMPANKRTLLFAMVDNFPEIEGIPKKVLFFKPENFSPFATTGNGYDAIMHGYEFAVARYTKQFIPGGDDLPEYRKERVPTEIISKFKNVLNYFNSCNIDETILKQLDSSSAVKTVADLQKQAKVWGLQYMQHIIAKAREIDYFSADPSKLAALEVAAKPCLEAMRGYDHVDRRTGREVYLVTHLTH